MARWKHSLGAALVSALLLGALYAHVRLINASNGRLLAWTDPAHIGIAISAIGSDDIADASHITAIQNSIASWNASTGTSARLVEDTSAATRARTDWAADDLHLVFFDETGASGFFPSGSSTVAVTPVWFTSNGRITDADVLFNGRGFSFTTSKESGAFDVQDVATHELGHLLGLDHSGSVGASLYPYVYPGLDLHRSIASDDEHGLRDAYPSGAAGAITGTVRRASDSSAVGGAYVVVRSSAGRTIASTLADGTGAFRIAGLAPDDYVLYATPLDYPVSFANLTPGRIVQIDFQSTTYGQVSVAPATSVAVGNVLVGPNTIFSLGRNFDPLPLGAPRDRTTLRTLHGTALLPGSSLISADASITIAPLAWMGNQVIFNVTVPADAEPGHVDLVAVSSAGDLSILPGALEIVPLSPNVITVAPTSVSDGGGTLVTISGRNFRSGLRVVIGGTIYEDGAPGGCTVVDSGTVTLTTAPTPGGTHDVVAIDSTGVEGRLAGGLQFVSVPMIASVFPPAGSMQGGTRVTLGGSGFVVGSSVRIDGVAQAQVEVESSAKLVVTTEPGQPGGPFVVEVENPGGAIATAAFSYVLGADPALHTIDPATSPSAGAVLATLHGEHFTPTTRVEFGVDPTTGAGGVGGTQVSFVDAQTLEVLVPAHPGGVVSVMVSEPGSGQAAVLPSSFTYVDDGSGGGGCSASIGPGPTSWRSVLEGSWWIALAFVAALCSSRSRKSLAPAHGA